MQISLMSIIQSRAVLFIFYIVACMNFNLLAQEKMNPMCPVFTDEKSEMKYKVEYKGKEVFFCCKKCLRKFNENAKKYEMNINYASGSQQKSADVSGHGAHSHNGNGHGRDHGKGHKSNGNWFKSLLGKFHPILVHFPIAGVFFTFLLQMVSFLFKEQDLYFSIGVLLILSVLSIVVATLSGWNNADMRSFTGEDLNLVFWHRWLAIASNVLVVLTMILHSKCKEAQGIVFGAYMFFLILSVSLISLTGHFGGILVYGLNYFNF